MKKKVNMFGKKIPMFAIFILGIALVSAALIGYFGLITGNVTVGQGLFLDGKAWDVPSEFVFNDFTSLEEKTFVSAHYLDNQASVPAEVSLDTVCSRLTGDSSCDDDITTSYSGVLELSGKSDCWAEGTCTLESIPKATVYYTIVGDEFIYEVVGQDGFDTSEYTLIYYPDTDGYTYTGKIIPADEITESLPIAGDLNGDVSTSTYCNLNSGEVNCIGAKLWLIPTTMIDFGTKKIIGWNGNAYLFETDLITYTKATNGIITLPAGSHLDFVINNHFSKMLVPDTYTITTKVLPA